MTLWILKKEVMEDLVIVGGLIAVQFVYAGNSVLLSYLLSLGLNALSLITFSALATFLILSPISFIFERKHWPAKVSFKLMVQLVLISFTGVTLFQSLMLKGIQLTSPAMATAMPNLGPALIFAIAWAFRLEKVKLSCIYSKMKILGTLLCVAGAITMSVMQATSANPPSVPSAAINYHQSSPPLPDPSEPAIAMFDPEKVAGCLYLMLAVFVLASNIVLQAQTLGDLPAPISLCAITSLIGVILTAAVEVAKPPHSFEIGWPGVGLGQLLMYATLVGSVSGTCVSFNGWAIKKRGPVLVSMFSPVSTVISAILQAISLGETIPLGSLGGMVLMFAGLYVVLWAKGKENYPSPHVHQIVVADDEDDDSIKKPLLC